MNIVSAKEIGSKVFFLKPITKMTCPICNGTGKISIGKPVSLSGESDMELMGSLIHQVTSNILDAATGNVKEYVCPECNGKGNVKMASPKYEVAEGVISVIRAEETSAGVKFVFSVNDSCCIRKLSDDNTWLSREDAQKRCDFLNLERRLVPIECIHVPRNFAATIPCNEKLMRRMDEWRKFRKFETEIYVDENLNMFDGYTSYLVYRMLGIMDVPVVIWPDGKRP